MNALVIGGTRFVGLRLVKALAREGHRITLLNRGKTQAELPAGIARLQADRRDGESVRRALAGKEFDVVFDMTGYQVRSLEPVLAALAGRIGHYLFQSTAGVYAESELLPIGEGFPTVSPVTTLAGFAAYEVEKVQCENRLLQAHRERDFPATIFRSPLIYGPENWMHDREFSFFVRLQRGLPVLVPGNGKTFLVFAHVDDVARAHLAAAGIAASFGQIYNVSSAEAITIDGYVDAIAGIAGTEPRKVYLDWSAMKQVKPCVFPYPSATSRYYSIDKAREHFGWRPQFDMQNGLRQSYDWWREALGVEKTQFIPGKLGNDVDLAYEAELARQYG